MKRFLTCALCFVSLPAIAIPLYYEQDGACPGLYKTKPSSGCNATRVSHLNVTPMADTVFEGFKINGQMVVYADGTVAPNAVDILRGASLGPSSKIEQTYSCKGSLQKNDYGFCVDKTGNVSYIDFENGDEENGYEIYYSEVGERGGGHQWDENCQYYSKFKVRVHWCPPKFGAYPAYQGGIGWNPQQGIPGGFNYPQEWPADCETGDIYEDLYYEWPNRTDQTAGNAKYRRNGYSSSNIVYKLDIPSGKFNGWTLRGFYLRKNPFENNSGQPGYYNQSGQWINCPENQSNPNLDCYNYWGNRNYYARDSVVFQTIPYGIAGTARLGLPTTVDTRPEYQGDIQLDDGKLYNWGNTRWAVWSCEPISEDATLHLYARWAKDCIAPSNGTCKVTVKRTGLYQNNDKGDVFYSGTCNDGTTPSGGDTYAPQCASPKQITYGYSKYMVYNGTRYINVSKCTPNIMGGTCNVGDDFVLQNPSTSFTCNNGTAYQEYKFARWQTNDSALHEGGASAQCSIAVLGGENANITGILCDCNGGTYSDVGSHLSIICAGICNASGGRPRNLAVGFTVDENVIADNSR